MKIFARNSMNFTLVTSKSRCKTRHPNAATLCSPPEMVGEPAFLEVRRLPRRRGCGTRLRIEIKKRAKTTGEGGMSEESGGKIKGCIGVGVSPWSDDSLSDMLIMLWWISEAANRWFDE